ncbi:hypothetical protein H4219_002466 [Mycoemilia scoparia]|uniref:Uncharacterized protein n=1 Tax=Mycoemilia scoparia TaxID=417184 RepID=A0A9W8A6V4_9FUNG|nr:hypothetical protein H4219_002466 [Mycoemilia scoparia]
MISGLVRRYYELESEWALPLVHPNAPPGWVAKLLYAKMTGMSTVGYNMAIANLVMASIIIITVAGYCFVKPNIGMRPSFRLSASLAVADSLFALCMIIWHTDSIMDRMKGRHLRALMFMYSCSHNAFVFTTCCIAFHLHLTVIYNKHRFAKKISKFYELIAWSLTILVSQLFFYFFEDVVRIKQYSIIAVTSSSGRKLLIQFWMLYVWNIIGLVYCFVICSWVALRLLPIWTRLNSDRLRIPEASNGKSSSATPHHNPPSGHFVGSTPQQAKDELSPWNKNSELYNTPPTQLSSFHGGEIGEMFNNPRHVSNVRFDSFKHSTSKGGPPLTGESYNDPVKKQRRRVIRYTIIRLVLYPIIPILCSPWITIYVSTDNVDWTSTMGIVMPSLQGFLCFVVFLANPALDDIREAVLKRIRKTLRLRRRRSNHSDQSTSNIRNITKMLANNKVNTDGFNDEEENHYYGDKPSTSHSDRANVAANPSGLTFRYPPTSTSQWGDHYHSSFQKDSIGQFGGVGTNGSSFGVVNSRVAPYPTPTSLHQIHDGSNTVFAIPNDDDGHGDVHQIANNGFNSTNSKNQKHLSDGFTYPPWNNNASSETQNQHSGPNNIRIV